MNSSKLLILSAIATISLSLLAIGPILVQAAPKSAGRDFPRDKNRLNVAAGPGPVTDQSLPVFTADAVTRAALPVCDSYYLHNQEIQIAPGNDLEKIANTTAPTGSSPAEISQQIVLVGLFREVARFLSDTRLAADLTITGHISGSAWVQTSSLNTSFKIEMFDYNPTDGSTTLLGDFIFALLSTGVNEVQFTITPLATTIPANHRLLFVFSAKKTTALLPTVKLFYDSANRPSHFTVCQPAPPALTISKSGPAAAVAGKLITYTLTVANEGGLAATNLVITDTLPAGANYVSGGTKTGNVVTWTAGALAPNDSIEQALVVTATTSITNSDYEAAADGGIGAVGQEPVVTRVSQPGQPNLTIGKNGPGAAWAGELITYTLTVANGGDTAATNLVISDVIPGGANYVTGGVKAGNVIHWTADTLAESANTQFTLVVTAAETITNSDYQVMADGNTSAVGQAAVKTIIAPEAPGSTLYLPVVLQREIATTMLVIDSQNTGGINPVQIRDPNNNDQLLLSCAIGNNVIQSCGTFPAIGVYKIVAHTTNCDLLQGTFDDAAPGATVTRIIFCN